MSSEHEPDLRLKAELNGLVMLPEVLGTWRDVEDRARRKRRSRNVAGTLVAVVAMAVVGYGGYSAYTELRPERAVVIITDPNTFEPGFGGADTSDPARTPSEEAARLAGQMAEHFAAADLVVSGAVHVADPTNPRIEFGLIARDSDKRFVNVIIYTSSGNSLPRDAISGGRPSEDVSIAGTTQAIVVELPKQEAWQIEALLPDHTVINIISGQSPQLGVSPRPPLDRNGVIEAVSVLMGLMKADAGSAGAYLVTSPS